MKFSRSLVDGIWRGFHCKMTSATRRNASALNSNEQRWAKQRQQETAQSKTHNSGEVELHSSQRNCGGQLIFSNDVRNNSPPGRGAKRKPNPEHENARKHKGGADRSCPGPNSKERCACSLPHHSTHHHNAPVHDVSNNAGWQREQEEWRGGRGCHE